MESRYDRFTDSDSTVHVGPGVTAAPQTGVWRFLRLGLAGLVLLVLLLLLVVSAVKFSALESEIGEVQTQLQGLHTSSSSQSVSALESKISEVQTQLQDLYMSSSSQIEWVPAVPLKPLTPVRGSCREGWASFRSHCYLLSKTTANWKEAEQQCQRISGYLLVPNDMEELDFISEISDLNANYWMGLVERQHEGHWSWVDGTHFDPVRTYWIIGQPDNWDRQESGEDCGQLSSTSVRKRRHWHAARCELSYNYVCEALV